MGGGQGSIDNFIIIIKCRFIIITLLIITYTHNTREYMNRNTIFRRRNNMHELLINHATVQ